MQEATPLWEEPSGHAGAGRGAVCTQSREQHRLRTFAFTPSAAATATSGAVSPLHLTLLSLKRESYLPDWVLARIKSACRAPSAQECQHLGLAQGGQDGGPPPSLIPLRVLCTGVWSGAHPSPLLLERRQLLLVHSRGAGVHRRQLGFGAHQLLHGSSCPSPLDGSVDPAHGLEHCREGGRGLRRLAPWGPSHSPG